MEAEEAVRARMEQAEIDAETAAARRSLAQQEAELIARVERALEQGDPEALAEAAVELHRGHALHEAKAGHPGRARAAVGRAVASQLRLARLRAGR